MECRFRFIQKQQRIGIELPITNQGGQYPNLFDSLCGELDRKLGVPFFEEEIIFSAY